VRDTKRAFVNLIHATVLTFDSRVTC